MAVSFSDEFHVSKTALKRVGALDIILDLDTKYFIDPMLLRKSKVPEFVDSSKKIEAYFESVVALVRVSQKENDMYWKKADSLLKFREIKGTCLGYSNNGTSGNAIGKKLRQIILRTIKELLKTGEVEPVILELMGVFQSDVGSDRISDLITFIIREDIELYTKRVLKKLMPTKKNNEGMLTNPYNNENILLLPREILSPLPIAMGFCDLDYCCAENERVRKEINEYFDLRERRVLKKNEIKTLILNNVLFREQMLENYKNIKSMPYNFEIDSAGQIIWYEASKQAVLEHPLTLEIPQNDDDLDRLVFKICNQLKQLIEIHGLWRLLYDDRNKPRSENAAQLLLYGVADSYCKANGIDISREVNNGRGPVDFKFSKGSNCKILVEVKLTSNAQLVHGIEKQLPIYMSQENTLKAYYLIIDNGHSKRFERFQDYYNKLEREKKKKIPYIYVDGNAKLSASRA